MTLHKINEIVFVFNQKTKKIYLEESFHNHIIQIYLSNNDLQKFSIDQHEHCLWRIYTNTSKNFVQQTQKEFEKLLLERFPQK